MAVRVNAILSGVIGKTGDINFVKGYPASLPNLATIPPVLELNGRIDCKMFSRMLGIILPSL
jgi:hypothetical protein